MGHIALTDDTWQVKDPKHPVNFGDLYLRASRPNLKVNLNWPDNQSDESG
jgi:hypothetical protein